MRAEVRAAAVGVEAKVVAMEAAVKAVEVLEVEMGEAVTVVVARVVAARAGW